MIDVNAGNERIEKQVAIDKDSRKMTSIIASINPSSVVNYLTKSELEALEYLGNNEEGVLLNAEGLIWVKRSLSEWM